MILRNYKSSDIDEIAKLFYETVHNVCKKEYNQDELNAWATGEIDKEVWNKLFLEHNTIIAVEGEKIIGFGDMDSTGYLDKLYIHKDYQGQKIATTIVKRLETDAKALGITSFTSFASITAQPFFEKMNYKTIRKNILIKNDVRLINYEMKSILQENL